MILSFIFTNTVLSLLQSENGYALFIIFADSFLYNITINLINTNNLVPFILTYVLSFYFVISSVPNLNFCYELFIKTNLQNWRPARDSFICRINFLICYHILDLLIKRTVWTIKTSTSSITTHFLVSLTQSMWEFISAGELLIANSLVQTGFAATLCILFV